MFYSSFRGFQLFTARLGQFLAQFLFVFKACHGHIEDGAYTFARKAGHDVGTDAGGDRVLHVRSVVVVGEHDDGAALVARGHDHMLERVACLAFGVDDDQVGLQLGYSNLSHFARAFKKEVGMLPSELMN